jgi:protein-arginine deiminase
MKKAGHFFFILLLPAMLLFPFSCRLISPKTQLSLQLAADVDRNGSVDFYSDDAGEEEWTPLRGALFLNNNDSDENSGEPDHADEKVNGSNDLQDLAILRLRQIPDLPDQSELTIGIDPQSQGKVRLFYKTAPDAYAPVRIPQSPNLDGSLLRQGDLELRIEANSYADETWNGIARVTATIRLPGGNNAEDSVILKVAPFILLSNLQESETIYVREIPGRNDELLKQLKEVCPLAKSDLFVIPAGDPYRYNHVWIQDAMEIGYSEIPGHRMNVVLKANRNKTLDQFPKDRLLGPDFGWFSRSAFRPPFAAGDGGNSWLDWFGNLEVTPPLPGFPLGRIYYGGNQGASLDPAIISLLNAQELQSPALCLDVGWLLIKHVDEMICFVPSGKKEKPYKLLVVDASLMIDLVLKWQKEGKGSLTMLEPYHPNMTVDSLARDVALMDYNRKIQKERMEPNIELLKKEFSLTEEDIIRIPALFSATGKSLVPNMVNSAVLNGYFLVADPRGPRENGTDLLQNQVREILKDIPLQIRFLDDRQYHKWSGNVHCATNVRRQGFSSPWWKYIN